MFTWKYPSTTNPIVASTTNTKDATFAQGVLSSSIFKFVFEIHNLVHLIDSGRHSCG